jgi:hypothetical protein
MNPLLLACGVLAAGPDGDAFVEITPVVERAADRGRAWLLKTQNRDGSWGISARSEGDVTCTALASMALMAGGNTQRTGPDNDAVAAVRRGLDYVLKQARRNPKAIVPSATTLVQSKLGKEVHTFLAVVFLSQAYGMEQPWTTPEERVEIREVLSAMCAQISRTQERDGSWHTDTFGGLKATCMAWLALRSAHSAGISVEEASVDRVVQFITRQYDGRTHLFRGGALGYASGGYQVLYASSSCLRVLYGMGADNTSVNLLEAYKAIHRTITKGELGGQFLSVEGEDYMAAAMITQAMMIDGGDAWREWYGFIREKLIKKQNADGSWTGTACIHGPTFATCCALLSLQAPYRLLPMQDL